MKRVLDEMGFPTGHHMTRLIKLLDRERQAHAARKKSEDGKRSRKKRRRIRKGIQDEQQEEEGVTYEAGGFEKVLVGQTYLHLYLHRALFFSIFH